MRWAASFLLVLPLLLFAEDRDRVRIHVHFDGRVIECHVPKDRSNRWLTIGVSERVASTREMNAFSPYVHRLELRQLLPCEGADVLEAFCALEYGEGKVLFSKAHEPCVP